MTRWCPILLHSAHAGGQCRRRVGAPYSSTVMLLTAGNVDAALVPLYCSTVLLMAGDVDTAFLLQYCYKVLLTAGNVNTALVPCTALQCLDCWQCWRPVPLYSALDSGLFQRRVGAPYCSTVLLTAGYVDTALVPHTAPQCFSLLAMSTQRWYPVQLHHALDSWQCQHSVCAPYSSTVLLTVGYVDAALVPRTAPLSCC